MTNDSYTKGVLTAIALCLMWLCAMTAGWPVQARQPSQRLDTAPQPVVVVGWGTLDEKGRTSVTMIRDRSRGLVSDPQIPVKVISLPTPLDVRLDYTDARPLPVGLTAVRPAGEWAPIRSAVEPEPVRSKPGGR
jgi:hypothetical protein